MLAPSLLSVVHLIGLALGVGAATVKLVLLLQSRSNPALVPVFLSVVRPITKVIILGLVLLLASGIGWIAMGRPFTSTLVAKSVLVAALFILGPIIDNVVEPKYRAAAPRSGEAASAEFLRAQQRFLALEIAATGIFYVIVVAWAWH